MPWRAVLCMQACMYVFNGNGWSLGVLLDLGFREFVFEFGLHGSGIKGARVV